MGQKDGRYRNKVRLGVVPNVGEKPAQYRSDDAVDEAVGQRIRPLANRLPADADAPADIAKIAGAAQQRNGGVLVHRGKHSSTGATATQTRLRAERNQASAAADAGGRQRTSADVESGQMTRIDARLFERWQRANPAADVALYTERVRGQYSADLARAIGVTPQRLRNMRQRGGRLTHEHLQAAARYLECDAEWLRMGEGAQDVVTMNYDELATEALAKALDAWVSRMPTLRRLQGMLDTLRAGQLPNAAVDDAPVEL